MLIISLQKIDFKIIIMIFGCIFYLIEYLANNDEEINYKNLIIPIANFINCFILILLKFYIKKSKLINEKILIKLYVFLNVIMFIYVYIKIYKI